MSNTIHPHEPKPATVHHAPGHAGSKQHALHRDWRVWLIVVLMLGAMVIYVLTLDLR
jgi:hypothetical protein